ncbi:hypothetical protein AB9N12_05565 [Bacteroides sp. AN502(2024)]|uniref:hypothetical protein n=1 Tax=Bacteroides sp. AN502(2024) TaxID=3160599 RepID=UPI0035124CF0
MKGFKFIINEAEVVLAAIPGGILNFILALDNSGGSIVVGLNGRRDFECHIDAGTFDPQRNSFIQWVGEFVPSAKVSE